MQLKLCCTSMAWKRESARLAGICRCSSLHTVSCLSEYTSFSLFSSSASACSNSELARGPSSPGNLKLNHPNLCPESSSRSLPT